MTKKLGLILGLCMSVSVLFWQGSPYLFAAPPHQETSTAADEAAEAAAVDATQELTTTATITPTLAELAAQVAALQAEVAALRSDSAAGLANEVTTAVYLLDTAGLHDLDVRLNEEGVIDPADAGTVRRVARLLSSVDWPADLAADAADLTALLNELADALSNDDVETAAALATEVHESQHDFSHAAEHWLEGITVDSGEQSAAGQAFRVTSAVYLLDMAGLHDLDVRLNEEGVIDPADAGTVRRVARLLSSVDWPADLAADAADLTALLTELADALSDDDAEAAATLATQVHESQHDFSHAAEHWLANLLASDNAHSEHGTQDHGEEEAGEDAHDHENDHGDEDEELSESGD